MSRSERPRESFFDDGSESPALEPAELELLCSFPPLRVVAIGEDWCPDVYHTLSGWARIADTVGWELRVFPRDEHPELMRSFLWNDRAERIPVYAFYSGEGRLQVWWSGRGTRAQRELDELLSGRSLADLDPEEKSAARQLLDGGYLGPYRKESFNEILTLLRVFFHRTGA